MHAPIAHICTHMLTRSGLGPTLSTKRAWLSEKLTALGLKVLPGHGAYFLVADVRWVGHDTRFPSAPLQLVSFGGDPWGIMEAEQSHLPPQHVPPLCSAFLKDREGDQEFCMRLTREAGVTLIPVSDA